MGEFFEPATNEIAAFRALTQQDVLREEDRTALVDQALLLIDRLYVHLMHKRAMYAIDPRQRLRLLRFRATRNMSDAQFHAELLQIFVELRDLHTNYILPRPYRGPVAFLGVLLEQYFEEDGPHWMVSKVYDQITGVTDLRCGDEVVYWNNMPIALAVARNGNREAGSNPAARTARGLERMTLRKLALSPVPDEDWVDLVHRVDGGLRRTQLRWRVLPQEELLAQAPGIDTADDAPLGEDFESVPLAQSLAVDIRTEAVRQVKRQLFAPSSQEGEEAATGEIPTTRPDELRARRVPTPDGEYGHLRIYSFYMKDGQVRAFIDEVRRLVGLLPSNGLIIDVRGNGGGYIGAAESLLQFFTSRWIRPEPMQLINSDGTLALCQNIGELGPWAESISDSVENAAQYSNGITLWSEKAVNTIGRIYGGPVVLITDALSYSATDMFAAGFQDHRIGWVLGTDDSTGAGGANVWTHSSLMKAWPGGPFADLPGNAEFRVALRRSLRVGKLAGQPLEDFGVRPDERHHLSRRDLLEDNVDLMDHAIRLLKSPLE
jgi:C-terminal processing protease CtpA/Prc